MIALLRKNRVQSFEGGGFKLTFALHAFVQDRPERALHVEPLKPAGRKVSVRDRLANVLGEVDESIAAEIQREVG